MLVELPESMGITSVGMDGMLYAYGPGLCDKPPPAADFPFSDALVSRNTLPALLSERSHRTLLHALPHHHGSSILPQPLGVVNPFTTIC